MNIIIKTKIFLCHNGTFANDVNTIALYGFVQTEKLLRNLNNLQTFKLLECCFKTAVFY